jgi:hypothetical protein
MNLPYCIALMSLAAASTSGCQTAIEESASTGSLRCVGYCELDIDKSDREIETSADGTVTETTKNHGITSDKQKNSDKGE